MLVPGAMLFHVLLSALAVDAQSQSIQSLIDKSKPHDTILLEGRTYHETDIVIRRPLVLVGRKGTIIDAQKKGRDVIRVVSDSVEIRGIGISNVAPSYVDDNAAVKLNNVKHCAVINCNVSNAFFGIYLARCSDVIVVGNNCKASYKGESQSGNGIHLWSCREVTIKQNRVEGHRDGIYFEFVKSSRILQNYSTNNFRYGLHFMFSDSCTYDYNSFVSNGSGVAVMYTKHVVMRNNVFRNNWGPTAYGILLKDISDSYMSNCRFYRNTTGIYAEGTTRITIEDCDVQENGWAMKIMANSMDDFITRTNFVGNTFDVTTNSSQSHSVFHKNYWSNYSGYDRNRDGTGDIPYAPVRLSAMIVEKHSPSLILLHSLFIALLDGAEKMLPTLTPQTMIDTAPQMKQFQRENWGDTK